MGGGFPLHRNLIVDLFRFYNPGNGDHFYTANKAEIPAGYISEGVACKVYLNDKEKLQWHLKGNDPIDVGLVPLFRYYNPGNGDHFYTANKAEIPAGYISEGVACIVFAPNIDVDWVQRTINRVFNDAVRIKPLFRYYNPGNGDHFYTANKAEIPAGYISEGIACYAYKSLPPLE